MVAWREPTDGNPVKPIAYRSLFGLNVPERGIEISRRTATVRLEKREDLRGAGAVVDPGESDRTAAVDRRRIRYVVRTETPPTAGRDVTLPAEDASAAERTRLLFDVHVDW